MGTNVPGGDSACCQGPGCCGEVTRRDFVAGASAAAVLTVMARPAAGGVRGSGQPAEPHPSHAVPVEKGLDRAWFDGLKQRGGPRTYSGQELPKIGMPIGGIATGQLYLGGDGRLLHWDIFNRHDNTGPGIRGYLKQELVQPVEQGFALRVSAGRGEAVVRSLDASGFGDVRFVGEYPIGRVEYRDAQVPVEVTLTAFSPFIPLNAEDSALPVTVMRFALKNTSDREVEASLAGWLANAVCAQEPPAGNWRSDVMRGEGLSFVQMGFEPEPVKPLPPGDPRPAIVFADFEAENYGNWTAEGAAIGRGPVRGNLPGQQTVSGFEGQGLVNTFLGGDPPTGKLTSPAFRIERRYINFMVGGGEDVQKLGLRLVVDGKAVRGAAGRNREALAWTTWPVEEFEGREARLKIVDEASGPWGHINIDQIEFSDEPRVGPVQARERGDFGTMGLGVVGGGEGVEAVALLQSNIERPASVFGQDGSLAGAETDRVMAASAGGSCGVGRTITIPPGETREITFVLAWHFANLNPGGRFYANRFEDARAAAAHVAENLDRLDQQTRLWHDTYYDSTLPHWLLDRLHMPISILASSTCQWWKNGRFWAWEGVGCCAGTCTHVWNYEQAMARLFPQLEQSVRAMQDFGAGFQPDSGLVGFRGESHVAYAADGQAGTILKAYREHLVSPDGAFLKQHWPSIRKALEFLFAHDANLDGVIENQQHNTYDIEFYGPNTFVGALYLAALLAAARMAEAMGEAELAASCRGAFERGSQYSMRQLFNGEYFTQRVDSRQHPWFQYGDGCLADQLFGQNWAHQLGLGHLYPAEAVKNAMASIWKYNWTADVGPQNKAHPPERVFAAPGEPGLFICTWPRSEHPGERGVRYRDEVWTGIEYEVAAGLIYEGLLDEGLAVVKAVDERYDAKKRNPWNEIECGDHYARAMASWGVLLALSGFEYDGPAGRLAIKPRITPEDFRCVFTAAQGWGAISQKRGGEFQENRLEVRHGELSLGQLAVSIPFPRLGEVTVSLNGDAVAVEVDWPEDRAVLAFAQPVSLKAGDTLDIQIVAPVP